MSNLTYANLTGAVVDSYTEIKWHGVKWLSGLWVLESYVVSEFRIILKIKIKKRERD